MELDSVVLEDVYEEKIAKLIADLDELSWFRKSGAGISVGFFDFKYLQIPRNVMIKEYSSLSWQMALNQSGNQIRRAISNSEYEKWNPIARRGLSFFDEHLLDLFLGFRENWDLNDAFVTWNRRCIVGFFINECFKKEGDGIRFYDKCLEVYLKGYYPCGWQGTNLDDGYLLIY